MRTLALIAMTVFLTQCGVKTAETASGQNNRRSGGESLRGADAGKKQARETQDQEPAVEECAGMLFYLQEDHGACDPAPDTVVKDDGKPGPREEKPAPQDNQTKPPAMDPAANGDPNVVVFRIKAGTGNGAWNAKDAMVTLKKGQVLRIVNDDTIVHRLHTNGAPCPHGNAFQPKASFDCQASKAFDPNAAGTIYDHNAGPSAEFWVTVSP